MVVDLVLIGYEQLWYMDTLEIIIVVPILLMYIGGIFVTPIIYYYETKILSDEQHNDDSVHTCISMIDIRNVASLLHCRYLHVYWGLFMLHVSTLQS